MYRIFITILLIFLPFSGKGEIKKSVQLQRVVIDAGHGGKDPGTIKGKVKEKDITLSVAKFLGEKIKESYPDVEVIYTRKDDTFVPLDQRAAIANKNRADLFISIHVNATKSPSARGTETFVMGLDKTNSNMEVCQLENSVFTLEDGYNTKYSGFDPHNPESYIIFSLLQNSHLEQSLIFAEAVQSEFVKGPITQSRGVKQAPFLVLWKCTMPSILVELGFLSNPNDYKSLVSKSSQMKFANAIFKAFEKYKKQYDKTIETPPPHSKNSPYYGIQIMSSAKLISSDSKELKGVKCEAVKIGEIYKYISGKYGSKGAAEGDLRKIQELFPDAFITYIK